LTQIKKKKKRPSTKKVAEKLNAKRAQKISPADFWRLKFLAERLNHDETLMSLSGSEVSVHLHGKEIAAAKLEISDLKLKAAVAIGKTQMAEHEESLSEYNNFRSDLEKSYGVKFEKININEESLEIIEN